MPDTSPRGTRIAHLGIAVESIAALLPFYRDILGLAEVPLAASDGARIAGLRLPTLFVFEGGYAVDAIGVNAVNVLTGFEGA